MQTSLDGRLRIERTIDPHDADTLAEDVLRGLTATPKWLPPKHFYDEVGGALFEAICELPEYYPTRAEHALLERHAREIVDCVQPTHLVELGSGSARKTRLLLDALAPRERTASATYVPIEINEVALEASARALLADYPWLSVRGIVGDFEHPLAERLPAGPQVLVAFLGGTVGNFEDEAARRVLGQVARAIGPGGWLLIGTDRVKDPWRLAEAYNDSRGVTARFNLNVLEVINRKLGGDFDLGRFRHLAFYDRVQQRIEMHVQSTCAQTAHVRRLDLTVRFGSGETLRTEISRKFTPESAAHMLEQAGYEVVRHLTPSNGEYSLWLARVVEAARPFVRRDAHDGLASPV